jgi:predicted small lipoprotein YifL
MKKLLTFLLALALILPLAACGSELPAAETVKTSEESKTEKATKEEKGEIVYPDTFSVGYARREIPSSPPHPSQSGDLTWIHDPLMLTCTAVWDGEKAALIMTADVLQINRDVHVKLCEIANKKFGIPEERIILSATHTHTGLTVGNESPAGVRFQGEFYKVFPKVVEAALRDLDEVESAFAGKGEVEEGITFVRRYLMPDGSYKTHGDPTAVAHETEADRELRTVRFDRKNKKDVLLVNYQTHHGGAGSVYPGAISADWVHLFREQAEKEWDCHFAYQSGAEGNINFVSPIPGERKYATFPETIPSFVKTTKDAIASEKKMETGKIRSASTFVTATVRKDSPERIALAEQVSALGDNEEAKSDLCKQIGFDSKYEASGILRRNKELGDTEEVHLSCITFGDFAFAAFPFEPFDTSGKAVRDASPFQMTFINSLSGGTYGYMPTEDAFPHGGYEVVVCPYTQGCAELFVEEMGKLINQCKG